MKTSRRSLFALAFAALAASSLGAASAAELKEVRIGFQKAGIQPAVKERGSLEAALKDKGLTVKWVEFAFGPPLLEALNTGNIDFGYTGDTPPIFAQAAGAQLAYVAEEAASPAAQAILVAQSSSIKTLPDLKGKRVAVTKGAGSHYLLLAALAKAGLTFKDITPAYLAPADGRAAFVSNNVDAWVAWDPFYTSARHQTGARILADGSDGLASYKRYYLASAPYAEKRSDVLNVIYDKLAQTGRWVKANPKEAATLLAGLWSIEAPIVEEANSHRSYAVGRVTPDGLAEQQKIADAFFAEGLIPTKVKTDAVKIWVPRGS